MDDADVASPLTPFQNGNASGMTARVAFHSRRRPRAAGKKCFAKGTNDQRICFTAVRFFRKSLEFCVLISLTPN
ncbi:MULTISPECIES: hypothetical protein [Sphingobium]|uniref:Uncharacterized protein n=1 Tax=Sphingobium fuliginis (strain ATCC 27551) TaxID=336203 RepID=A0A7M2GKY3_SPHSA|nr:MULTISPECIES: hypothetical protein [Sphingobium]MCB4860747.1 hypothetical protein [Sphingobium sp. PNB]QOT72917.1 hypothetical protein H5V43_07370 [Sphingobium fuliginis]